MKAVKSHIHKSILVAACLTMSTNIATYAQPGTSVQGIEVDLKEVTSHFAKIFENACYQHRHSLAELKTKPPVQEWQKILGSSPIREENQGSTTLVEWGGRFHGVSYTTALVNFDSNYPIITCIVFSTHMHKATLPEAISRIGDLKTLKEVQENGNTMSAIGSSKERNLRVVCTTPIEDHLYNGQCALWLATDVGS